MAACHCFGVLGEAVQTTSDHAINTARPKADEQCHIFPDFARDAGPSRPAHPARYIAHGWPIGSGVIDSACKTVVNQRPKGCGMRWRERGTTALCQARALYKSEHSLWSAYWKLLTAA